MITDPLMLLFCLIGFHFLCDFPLQADFMSKGKNPRNPIPQIPWYTVMFGHATIHGTAVAMLTGSVVLGLFEIVCHFIIDTLKCRGGLSFNQDQILHILLKVLWWVYAIQMPREIINV